MQRDKHDQILDYLASLRFPVVIERATVTGYGGADALSSADMGEAGALAV